jgi:hypothetical protein
MSAAKPELKAECIRLRIEERLSLKEIHRQTGASKGSLSAWLRPHPLTEEERREKFQKRNSRGGGSPKKDRGVESDIHRIVRMNKLDGVQVAKVAESAVLFRLVIWGFNPFGSSFDGDRTDWLVEIPKTNSIVKIQVKSTCQQKLGLPIVELRHGGNRKKGCYRYQKGDFHFIVGYDLYTDTCYIWSWAEVEHLKTAVTVCPEARERWDKLVQV